MFSVISYTLSKIFNIINVYKRGWIIWKQWDLFFAAIVFMMPIILDFLGIYVLVLLIKALKIYIDKNL